MQGAGNRGEATVVCRHRMSYESLRKQRYLRKIHENRLVLLVDAKVAEIHVRLREHQAIVADLYRRHPSLDGVREYRVRLSHIPC